MLKIQFSDTDWTDVNGRILKMSVENELFINSRLSYNYLAPVITEDVWNGKQFPVQINIWESCIIEFAVKEMAIHMMNKLQSCENIICTDLSTGEIITLDTQSSGAISLEPSDRFDTNQFFNLICRSNKISIFPGIARHNTNILRIVKDLVNYDFYTDKDIISFVSDPEISKVVNYQTGLDSASKTVSKNGKKMVFYLMETQAIDLKKKIENVGYTSILINPLTDNIPVLELGICKLSLLSEGLYKCEVDLIISGNLMFKTS
jgi:hypothetical protein